MFACKIQSSAIDYNVQFLFKETDILIFIE
jgi:hypothetical protein